MAGFADELDGVGREHKGTMTTTITCKHCGAVVPPKEVNSERMFAKCEKCDTIFDIASQLGKSRTVPRVRMRSAVEMPKAIRLVIDDPQSAGGTAVPYRAMAARPAGEASFTISRRWFHSSHLVMLLVCLFWNGMLVMWFRDGRAMSSWTGFLAPVGHVAAGLVLAYVTIAGLLNSTTISARNGTLSIRHRPVPWAGNVDIPTTDIKQLFTTEKILRSRNSTSTTRRYALEALLSSGDPKKLLEDLPEADQALFIEQQLESRLGILDAPVPGEYDYGA